MSLRNKILILTIGLISFLGLILVAFVNTTLKERLLAELKERGAFLAQTLAEISVHDVLTENNLKLQLALNDYQSANKEIEYIFIMNAEREIIVHTFKEGFPTDLKNANQVKFTQEYNIQPIIMRKVEIYDIAVPLLKGHVGFLRIGFSAAIMNQHVDNINRLILGIIVAVLILGSSLAVVFAALLTKPLDELTRVTEELCKGNLKSRAHIMANDESGQLGNALNMMIDYLHKTTVSLDYVDSIINIMGNALIVIDPIGRIEKINRDTVLLINMEQMWNQ